MEGVGASSFEFYDGVRIFVPGAIAFGLFVACYLSFGGTAPSGGDGTLAAFAGTALFGLGLYFVEAPPKSVSYKSGQPTDLLQEWGVTAPPGIRGLVPVYLLLVDEVMPSPIRNRSLYSGAIFRIGFEAIYLLGTGSIGVLAAAGFLSSGHVRLFTPRPPAWWFGVAACGHLVIWLWTLYTGLTRASRELGPLPDRSGSVVHRFASWARRQADRVSRRKLVSLSLEASLVLATGFVIYPNDHVALALCGPAVAWLVWAVSYFRGWTHGPAGHRSRLYPLPAVGLFSYASAMALWVAARVLPTRSPIPQGWVAIWLAVGLLAAILIASRGHERRLFGSYSSQRTWLILYRPWVMHLYFKGPEPLRGLVPPWAATRSSRVFGDSKARDGSQET